MTHFGKSFSLAALGVLLAVSAVCGLSGCAGGGGAAGGPGAIPIPPVQVPPISIGDSIVVVLSDIPGSAAPLRFEDKVKEDGTITLHLGRSFKAVGQTALQLQQEIEKHYVPAIYKRLTVSVTTGEQYYIVTGFVKAPSQYKYMGPTTLTKAIATAGYFDLYGSHTVILIRGNGGQRLKVNYDKIIKRPELDLPIFPGDTIQVPKRTPFG